MHKTNYYLVLMMSIVSLFILSSCSGDEDKDPEIDITQIQSMLDGGTTPKALYDDGVTLEQLYGKMYEGGLIFYLNTTDGTGMVAATQSQSDGAIWGCGGIEIDGADSDALGFGAQNTKDILAGCTTDGIAAELCDKLDLNGKTDWFLPSIGELNLMAKNLHANGYGGFEDAWHWSSTEFSQSIASINTFSGFGVGNQGTTGKNNTTNVTHVRAARSF